MSRTTLRGAVLLLLTFFVGALAGVAVDRTFVRSAPVGARLAMRMPELLDQLGLSPTQRQAADSILAVSSPRSEAAMREMVPRLSAIADTVNMEIAAILTPGQRVKFDSLMRRPVFLLKRKDSTGRERVDTVRR